MAAPPSHQRFDSPSSVGITPNAHLNMGGVMVSNSIDTRDMWEAYSEGSEDSYQGLDQEWMQRSVSEHGGSIGLNTLYHQADITGPQNEPCRASDGLKAFISVKRVGQDTAEGPEGSEDEDKRSVSSHELTDMTKNVIQDSKAESCDTDIDTKTKSNENWLPDVSLPNEHSKANTEATEVGGSHTGPQGLKSHQTILDALKQQTEDLLSPSPQPRSRHASSPGVEAAKKEYDQGLLSTKTFHRDCLPPALLCSKATPSSSNTGPDTACPTNTAVGTPSLSPTSPDQHKGCKVDGSSLIVKRRHPSEQQQPRRINQQPLSAIYEEPASIQPSCGCNLCSEATSGRGIVWFHLCPRYVAMAREKGIKYEPYEGRVILHHGPNGESVGLIIEGPMEDRFLPARNGEPTARAFMEGYLQSPASDTQSALSGTSHRVGLSPQTASSKVLRSIPARTLERSISPGTPVSRPASINLLSVQGDSETAIAQRSRADGGARSALSPKEASLDDSGLQQLSQPNVHPALRNGGAGRQEWSRPPTKSQSLASFRQHLRGRHQSIASEGARVSLDYANLLGEPPTRIDSLGAPSYSKPAGSPDASSIHSHTALTKPWQFTSSSSFIPPCVGHQRVPSTFLAPSTPSTASFMRNSTASYETSNYDDPLPTHIFKLREAGLILTVEELQRLYPLRSPEDPMGNTLNYADEAAFTPESCHTASASYEELSPRLHSPPTGRTTQTSTSLFPSKDLPQLPPLPVSNLYLRPGRGKYSYPQNFANLHSQADGEPSSRRSPLSANPLDNAQSTASKGGEKNVAHEDRYAFNDTPHSSSVYSNDPPLLTANLTTPGDISISNSFQLHARPASEQIPGLGITSTSSPTSSRRQTITWPFTYDRIIPKLSPRSKQRMIQKPLPPDPPRSSSDATTDELELFVTRTNPAQRPSDRLRTSQYEIKNWCTYPKLHSTLGDDMMPNPSSPNANKSPAMKMKEVVKKGSRMVMEGGSMLKEKMKAGFRVRDEDFRDLLDEDN
ncbi:MAG: hypothetical protein LQ352_002501 [Teloschistes flavicans]|nr:MAG: hypothetical protein LQ352_002501 [Teloschistes flavicans]